MMRPQPVALAALPDLGILDVGVLSSQDSTGRNAAAGHNNVIDFAGADVEDAWDHCLQIAGNAHAGASESPALRHGSGESPAPLAHGFAEHSPFQGLDFAWGASATTGSTAAAGPDAGSAGAATSYYSGSYNGWAGYDISIKFVGVGWTAELQNALIQSADYFTSVIRGDVGGNAFINGTYVDDLQITATLAAIDGVGNVLGQAGPTYVWWQSYLPAIGAMTFDNADAQHYLNTGLWDDIVTHEMMHVLGFGTLWEYGPHDLLNSRGEYVGPGGKPGAALAAYRESHPNSHHIPVEHDGGPGTAGAHWDETALRNELMTGYIDQDNHLSKVSVMSLADLGYPDVEFRDYPYDDVAIA